MIRTSRTRSRVNASESFPGLVRRTVYYPGSYTNPPPLYSDTNLIYNGRHLDEEVCTDVVTKNYKKLSAQGHIINHPFSKGRTVTIDPLVPVELTGTIENYRASTGSWYPYLRQIDSGNIPLSKLTGSFPSFPDLDYSDASANAINGAWANAQQSKMLALVTAGEFSKTVTSLIGILQRVLSLGKILSGKKKPNMTKDDLSNFYLECRYAYRPMIYEVLGVIDALKAVIGKQMRQTFRSGDSKAQINNSVIHKTYGMQSSFWVEYDSVHNTYIDVSVKCGVLTDIEVSLAALLGFDNIIESIVELVPFSFILNWFFTISRTIAAWTPNIGVKTLASWTTTKIVKVQTSTIANVVYKTAPDTSSSRKSLSGVLGSNSHYTCTAFSTVRSPNPRRAIFPVFEINLDAAKLLDLVLIGRKLLF